MNPQTVGGADPQLAAVAALAVIQKTQTGQAAVQAAVSEDSGSGAAPIVSASVQAPGSLEIFA